MLLIPDANQNGFGFHVLIKRKHACFISTARLHIVYPMLFKLSNSRSGRNTHCGVLEFVADEGKIYLPYWVRGHLINHIHVHVPTPLKDH